MMKFIKDWWPVAVTLFDIAFVFVMLFFMIMAMTKGKWDEAIFWLLLRAVHTIKDKS